MSEDIPSTAPGTIVRWSGWSAVWQRLVKRAERLGATLCPIWGLWIFSYRHYLTHSLTKACDTLLLYSPYHLPHKIKSITPITNYFRQKALTAMAATLCRGRCDAPHSLADPYPCRGRSRMRSLSEGIIKRSSRTRSRDQISSDPIICSDAIDASDSLARSSHRLSGTASLALLARTCQHSNSLSPIYHSYRQSQP
jgi:hypothetical protein